MILMPPSIETPQDSLDFLERAYLRRRKAPIAIVSNGTGIESWTIIARMLLEPKIRRRYAPQDLLVLGIDTGAEHPETYEHSMFMRDFCRAFDTEFVFVTADMGYHAPSWRTLETQWQRNNTVGSTKGFKRSCTTNLKLDPFYKWVDRNIPQRYGIPIAGQKKGLKAMGARLGKIDVILGFSSEEVSRCATPADLERDKLFMKIAINRVYPLIEWGWSRADSIAYLRAHGLPVPVPSQCIFCPYKGPIDVLWTARFYPEQYARWTMYEAKKKERFADREGANHGVFGAKTIDDVREAAEEEFGHLSDEELHERRITHNHGIPNKY